MKKSINKFQFLVIVVLSIVFFSRCSSNENKKFEGEEYKEVITEETLAHLNEKGIGPISEVKLGEINNEMAKKGEDLFNVKCSACHAIDTKIVGPSLAEVTNRRSPEWIMNMILNPEEMIQNDAIAKELFNEFSTSMTNMNLTKEEAREILEYFRKVDKF